MRNFIATLTLLIFIQRPMIAQMSLETHWADSIYNTLSEDQRIGQLIMIRAHSNLGADHIARVEDQIQKYHIGSLCFFQGTPARQVELTNRYQALSKVPLFIAIDGEWGLNMRLKEGTIAYPKQLMLGAIPDNAMLYQFGKAVAKECRRIGVHINFAPCVDVNNNANNPVINERSFGENQHNVAAKGSMYAKGLQDNGVMACAKHFPGHGDTDKDSHYDLPIINHDMARLTDVELMPFRVLGQLGVESMMVSHLFVPSIDATQNTPATLSRNAIRDLLRQKIGYDGLIFTDGLEMKSITRYWGSGELSARAIEAGCDILCLPEDIPASIASIKKYIAEGRISAADFEASVKRILRAKYRYGLHTPQYSEPSNLSWDLLAPEHIALKRDLVKNALTVVRDEDKLLPFVSYQPDSIATLAIGSENWTHFQYSLNNAGLFNQFNIGKYFSSDKKAEMLDYFSKKKIVILSLHGMKPKASDAFGLSPTSRDFINELAQRTKVVLVIFGNPYSLKYFDAVQNVLVSYNEDKLTQELTALGLFGAFEFKGKLPISASEKSRCGWTQAKPDKSLKWRTEDPEAVGMDSQKLGLIDRVANELIDKGAAPSCQILVAKNGQVVYHKAFGHHTYERIQTVDTETVYDLASITKCAATTLSLMKLYEEGKLDLEKTFGDYLPTLNGSNKASLKLKDVLIHQAGLLAWIPFYLETLDSVLENGKNRRFPSAKYYARLPIGDFTIPVAQNLFMRRDYVDTLKMRIAHSPLRENCNYTYSDLGLILLTDVIKNITGKTLDTYAKETFYTPLSMNRTLFNPLTQIPESDIAPTEEDNYFRMARVRGTVHDMAAAQLGGVSGHAGLFSTTADLAILFQMLLNGGEYGGVRYLKAETIKLFTSRQGGSTRRGYGWDMKELSPSKILNMSAAASANTYGHTGFTGNAAYVDPDKNLIYIFLSNRTYPNASNKLIDGNYRTRIQSLIYEAIKE
jgi:beta-glucosidase-like glycosyl hydrolase/CubicO group peptidase (beta-lactamase class C family)